MTSQPNVDVFREFMAEIRSDYERYHKRFAAKDKELAAANAEIYRLRTTETAAAHALDVLRQEAGLHLVDGEHPAETGKRITAAANARVRELEEVVTRYAEPMNWGYLDDSGCPKGFGQYEEACFIGPGPARTALAKGGEGGGA